MATVPHVTSGSGLRKFQADGFLLDRVYIRVQWNPCYKIHSIYLVPNVVVTKISKFWVQQRSERVVNEFITVLWCSVVDRLKCDGTRAETRFRLSPKRTSQFKSAGASVHSTTGSRGVRIIGSNAGYTMFGGSVKITGYPLHSPVSPSFPLPCVTVCHQVSTGLYRSVHYGGWTSLHKQQHILHATPVGQQRRLEAGQNELLHYVSDNSLFICNSWDS